MTTRVQDHIEKHIRGLINNPSFTLSDENYKNFLSWVKDISPEPREIEMALAFLTIQTMSNDKLIIERDKVKEDVTSLIKVIIHMYKHVFDNKSTLLLLMEAVDEYVQDDVSLRTALIRGETDFESIVALIRKPIHPQPLFVQ